MVVCATAFCQLDPMHAVVLLHPAAKFSSASKRNVSAPARRSRYQRIDELDLRSKTKKIFEFVKFGT